MTKENNHTEELIFDYLEGNLSHHEKEAFELLMADDMELMREVKAWKETFITASFPTSRELEEHILNFRPVRKNTWTLTLNSMIWLSLILCVPSPIQEDVPQSGKVRQMATASKTGEAFKQILAPKKVSNVKMTQSGKPTQVDQENRLTPDVTEIVSFAIPTSIKVKDPSLFTKIIVSPSNKMPPLEIASQSSNRQLLRRDIRKINRQKRREFDKKSEAQFLKGNAPYVVPLDMKNF
jgi:hypothetical protein